jgi:hypothetical protein
MTMSIQRRAQFYPTMARFSIWSKSDRRIRNHLACELAVVLSTMLGAGCTRATFSPIVDDTAITCVVTRQECSQEQLGNGNVTCHVVELPVTFTATACYQPNTSEGTPSDKCNAVFCAGGHPGVTYPYATCGAVGSLATLQDGVCKVSPHSANVVFAPRSRQCTPSSTLPGACDALSVVPTTPTTVSQCWDLSATDAYAQVSGQIPADNRDISFNIISITDTPKCTSNDMTRPDLLTYSIPAGSSLGTVTGAGVTTTLPVVRGTAVVAGFCDVEGCDITSLDQLHADVGNITVSGIPVTNAVVQNSVPAPLTLVVGPNGVATGIASHAFKLRIVGKVNGVDSLYTVENRDPWLVDVSATGVHLAGALNLLPTDLSGRLMPVTVTGNVSGTLASAQVKSCLQMSSIQRLFGFEDVQSWSSQQASLSLVTSPTTQGCGALGIDGQYYFTVSSAPFSTAGLAVTSALSVDLFVPPQSGAYTGALQTYLTCPSGGVFNQFIGQVEITGKPKNAFSTLRYPLPSSIVNILKRSLNDCSFTFGVNVTPVGKNWILDNLRFTQ